MENEKRPLRPDVFLEEGGNGTEGHSSVPVDRDPLSSTAGEEPMLTMWEPDDFAEAAEEEGPAVGARANKCDMAPNSESGTQAPQEAGFTTEAAASDAPLMEKEPKTVEEAALLQGLVENPTEETLSREPEPATPRTQGSDRPVFGDGMADTVENFATQPVEKQREATVGAPITEQASDSAEVPSDAGAPLTPDSNRTKNHFNPQQNFQTGEGLGAQRINSTGYQHYQQGFQQEPGRFPPQGQSYPPFFQARVYRQHGTPAAHSPWDGYAPPPYQAMNGVPQSCVPSGAELKKKMKKGTRIFLWIACGLAACFTVAFGVYGTILASRGRDLPVEPGASQSQPDWGGVPWPGDGDQPNLTPGGAGAIDPDWGGAVLREQPEGEDPMGGNAVYEKAKQSVVGIRLYEPDAQLEDSYIAEGSGVVMTADGYIITNSHVLGDSDAYGVQVVLYTGEEYVAKVVGYDKKTDLAVIKIEVSGLTAAEFGNSDDLRVGDRVYALGNPGGLNYFNSLTGGWVSALDRAVDSTAQTAMRYIQTDAAINPGNSGGALLNRFGQVVGINTAKIQGYEGMGFAIPMTTVKGIIDDLMRYGYVSGRVRLGITGQQISTYVARRNGVPQGVLIRSLSDDSPLQSQGVQVDDIITHINGIEITAFEVLTDELARFQPGDLVTLTIYRDGNTFDVEVPLLEDRGETQQPVE